MHFLRKLFGPDPSRKSKEYFKNGLQLNKQNDPASAIEAFTKAIEMNVGGNNSNVFFNRANSKAKLGNHIGAVEDYTNSISVSKFETYDVYYNRGNSKCELKDYLGAVEDYTKVISINSKIASGFTNRARALAELGRFDEVIQDYLRAYELDTAAITAKTCFELATAFYKTNRLEDASKWCEFSLAYNRNFKEAKDLKEEVEQLMGK